MAVKKSAKANAKTSTKPTKKPIGNARLRKSFAKIPDVMEIPNLIGIQTDSFD